MAWTFVNGTTYITVTNDVQTFRISKFAQIQMSVIEPILYLNYSVNNAVVDAVRVSGVASQTNSIRRGWAIDFNDVTVPVVVSATALMAQINSWLQVVSGTSVADADYGDVTVSGAGTVWTIDNDVVTYAKMQNVSATDRLLGRDTAGAGDVEEITPANVKTMLSLNNVENTALSTWAGSGNITTVGTITSGAAMQEGAEASITNNSGAANDTQVPTTTCRFYNFFTLPTTGKLYVITGIEWKNGTVVAGLVVCAIQQVDASPPTNAIVILSALGQTVTATGTSSVQRVSVISTNVFRGGALLAVFIQGANATQRFMTATVGSSNIRKNVTSTASVENADGSAWVAYTEQAYCKIYYREYK